MGATEKGGKKSRRLFSSLRPWKATRRLWRTRSARKAAQGECGRGRGPVTARGGRRPLTAGAAAAPAAGGGIEGCVLGRWVPRAARPGRPSRPGDPPPWPSAAGTPAVPDFPWGLSAELRPGSRHSPLAFPCPSAPSAPPVGSGGCSLYISRKSPCLSVWLWTEGIQGAPGTQSTQVCVPPTPEAAPAMQHPLGE